MSFGQEFNTGLINSLFQIIMFYKNNFSRRSVSGAAFFLFICFFLFGCYTKPLPLNWLADLESSPKSFEVCHGYGCHYKTRTSLAPTQWAQVLDNFNPPAKSAVEERKQIARAIAMMETITGESVGTQTDVAEAGFYKKDAFQMDCIDETVNTSLYLHFMEREGVFRWHKVGDPERRGYFVDWEWPHNTAVVVERETGIEYAIDSWFFANGKEPWIVPVKDWWTGLRPNSPKK